ncbi:sigma-54-dependent transcriptional regulator [Mesoterricola silvestris]|uniref:Acetoacetate metabolism regulatory protein AtoC n=1 Tax=Mesoterricola silvestris TaxID=2927979 RepID=A0AA48GPN5_9BACT|nr:sigma-54 dependent transcriptional regulator [Mesoterricola silvestris]BDU71865.1 acetoacetate metabolism regulatory protein AtoC [Mesoterricola silvestris]
MTRILVVDDDLAIREMVALALEKCGYRVDRAPGLPEARAALDAAPPGLVVCDLYLPGGTGLDLLEQVRALPGPPPMILMTARGSMETTALALNGGVFDYIAKPFDLDVLLERVRAALGGAVEAGAEPERGPASMMVGSHPAMVEAYKATGRVAAMAVPVLVLGETGTGKELVARALHRFGGHPEGPFVPVHCGAIPDTLIESELFGHRRGAFTDAQRDRRGALALAHGGTVFLDEIGEISPVFQVKLLRFLEDGIVQPLGAEKGDPVKVRVVAATHRDLRALVAAGSFRQDLYYRLAGFEIRLPALRDRLSDLPDLVQHFQERFRGELGLPAAGPPSREVLAALAAHPWPGNVRELGHVVRRLLIETGALGDAAALGRILGDGPAPGAPALSPASFGAPFVPLEEMERMYLLAVLAHARGNKTEAARILGIERKTLTRKLRPADCMDTDDAEGGAP